MQPGRLVPVNLTIRKAELTDADLLTELGRKTYSDAFSAQNTSETMALYLESAFNPRKQPEELSESDSLFLIAEESGKPVGYARMKFGAAPECIHASRPMEIIRFYSLEEYIGRGVGKALMEACLAEANKHGCDVVWLGVWKQNPRGIAFYKKWGFEPAGEQDFIMGNETQSDWIMKKSMGNTIS